jgi:hypothetical protein
MSSTRAYENDHSSHAMPRYLYIGLGRMGSASFTEFRCEDNPQWAEAVHAFLMLLSELDADNSLHLVDQGLAYFRGMGALDPLSHDADEAARLLQRNRPEYWLDVKQEEQSLGKYKDVFMYFIAPQ